MSSNFTSCQVGLNFLVIYILVSIHFQFCFRHMNPYFTTLYNQMLSHAIGLNFDTFHPCQLQQPLQYWLVDQLYAKEVYFCSFVTKSNQTSTKYLPVVFNSFYRTAGHGGKSPQALPSRAEFPYVSLWNCFLLLPPQFFHCSTPNLLQRIYKTSIGLDKSPHKLFFCFKISFLEIPKGTCSFNRP